MNKDEYRNKDSFGKLQNSRPTIGFLIDNLTIPYQSAVWHGVVDMARAQEVNLICFVGGFLQSPRNFEAQANVLYDLIDVKNLDGLVILCGTVGRFVDIARLEAFCKRYHPLPIIGIETSPKGVPCVTVDNYQGMCDVIRHFIKTHGYRRIAFVRGPKGHPEAERRYHAYVDMLTKHNLPLDPDLVVFGDFHPPSGAAAVHHLLDRRNVDFEALAAANDDMILGALEALQARGLRVPDHVAVAGFDDVKESSLVMPPLTTARQPMYEQGRQAVRTLLALIAGEDAPEQTILSTELVVRQSCGCFSQEIVQAAVEQSPRRPIETHATETFETVLEANRTKILAAVANLAVYHTGKTDFSTFSEQAAQLLDSFVAEVKNETRGKFLSTLNDILRLAMANGNVAGWQNVISALRRQTWPYLKDNDTRASAENLWQQARVMIAQVTQQAQSYREMKAEQQAQTVRDISQDLIITFNIENLMNVIAQGLPRLNIPGACFSLYENPETPAGWARLILAHQDNSPIALKAGRQRFPSPQLMPREMWNREKQFTLVAAPLYFRERQQGIALFEVGPQEGKVYETLAGEISRALEGTLLLQERKQAEKALERAYAAVEKQVEERTAELKQEIIERERAEMALATEHNLLRTLIDNIPDYIYVKDTHSRFLTANSAVARLMGAPAPADLYGKTDFDFYEEELAAKYLAAEQQVIESRQAILNYEEPSITSKNERRWLLTSKLPLKDSQGNLIGFVGIGRDITKRKRAEEEQKKLIAQLEEKNAELIRFTYAVSHDLKSPLITIGGFLGIVEKDAMAGNIKALQKDMKFIRDAASQMKILLDDLMELSRIGRLVNPPQFVPLNDLAQEAVELVAGQITGRGVKVIILPNLPTIYGDRPRLLQVLQNLIDNAVKYMGPQLAPRIEIGARLPHRDPIIYVKDNGAGIEPQFQEQIFGLFERLEEEIDGTGMGLALVKRIIEVHGGQIWVESEGEGFGSTFCFTLPRNQE